MKIRQNVAWVGNSIRVVALELGVAAQPLVLSGDAALFWMSLSGESRASDCVASIEPTSDLIETLDELGLIEL